MTARPVLPRRDRGRRLPGGIALTAGITAARSAAQSATPPAPFAAALALLTACSGAVSPTSTGAQPVRPVARSVEHSATAPGSGSPGLELTAGRSLTIVAGGDVLLHEDTWTQADADAGVVGDGELDFRPMLAGIAPFVSGADLALCHLETPLAAEGAPYEGYPTFAAPPQIVPALRDAGFDACSVASNHTFDQGVSGVERTLAGVTSGGITPYGAAVGGAQPNPTIVTVGDVRVGLLSYAYGVNGSLPRAGVIELLDAADITGDARTARAAGADVVVVSVHWGTEYDHQPNAQQLALAPVLASSPDIDLVIGHHAHVVQPMALVDGTWVAFGLGNMVAAQSSGQPGTYEGVLARFTLTRRGDTWAVTEAAYLPTVVSREPALRVLPLTEATATTPALAAALADTRRFVRAGADSAALVELTGP